MSSPLGFRTICYYGQFDQTEVMWSFWVPFTLRKLSIFTSIYVHAKNKEVDSNMLIISIMPVCECASTKTKAVKGLLLGALLMSQTAVAVSAT